MQREPGRPIFIVGSPRSGTSILAWCLGQHPNIFPVPESNWMGEFALNIVAAHQIGVARGERSILSAMEIHADEFFAMFGQTINDLVLSHREALEKKQAVDGKLKRRHSKSEPKARWVDATPEYAFHICGLRKLFPKAVFIHLVRDVDSVVCSMLNFHRVAGTRLVVSEEQAYDYWLRAVESCLRAEEAYGPTVIHRLLYSTLIEDAESAMRDLLDFVGEQYDAKCLDPLKVRINSSNVPSDFKSDDPATDPAVVKEARRLSTEIEHTKQRVESSGAAVAEIEAAFRESSLKRERIARELKDQIRELQRHHAAEVDEYKMQIGKLQQHHITEIDHYKSQIVSQQRHFNAEAEEHKSQIRKLEQEHARITRTLMGMLSKVEKAAARLRDSRRWKLVNFSAAMKAKISPRKEFPGYGDLDKIVAAYSRWRASHAEIANASRPPTVASAVRDSPSSVDRLAKADATREPVTMERLTNTDKTCGA